MKFLRFLALGILGTLACHASDFGERMFKAGQNAERAGDSLHAYLLYSQASAAEPTNMAYASRKSALRAVTEFTAQIHVDEPEAGGSVDAEMPTPREVLEARLMQPPPTLTPSSEKKSFNLRIDPRAEIEQVAAAYGYQAVFDRDFQTPPQFRFQMMDVGYLEALRALESAANSFFIPVDGKTFLVARDTPAKRSELAPMMSVGILIPERMTVQEAQEMITAVQQSLDIRRMTVDPTRHMVYVRDQVTKVRAAQQMFATLSRLRTQVEIDVELISVAKNSSLDWGLNLPSSFPLVNFGHAFNSTPGVPQGFTQFLTFGGGATFLGLGITEATTFATVSKSSASSLLKAQIVSVDGQAATLHVGDRYPILTSGYYGNATGSGTVYTPPPTVDYQDLGLVVKVTPSAHDGEVTLDLETEFKLLGAPSSIQGIPIVSERKFNGKVRLKYGEWAIIAGLVETTDTQDSTGIAGAFNLPLIGKMFSKNEHLHSMDQVLLILKPHLASLPPWENPAQPIWVGTETKPVSIF